MKFRHLLIVCCIVSAHAAPNSSSSEDLEIYLSDNGFINKISKVSQNVGNKASDLVLNAMGFLGVPYRRGGSDDNGFDCSGFVSYVLTNSGLYNTGRLGAQGLYNISTPVSNPQPGDLVFFTGTYDTPGVSHVGIYVGEDGDGSPVMLHCGDPIQYSKLDTSYWQSHFYAYGRLNYN